MQNVNALPAQTLELKDIHVPEQISNFPIAYGWWLLSIILILLIVMSIINIRKRTKRNAIKKQALKQLMNSPEISIDNTVALLKWAAMHYFSRAEIAKLFGDSLQQFLTSKLPLNHRDNFSALSEQAFINQYKTPINNSNDGSTDEKFTQAAKLWLTHALPPKTLKELKVKTNTKRATIDENTVQGTSS